jgi:hypothetical protein
VEGTVQLISATTPASTSTETRLSVSDSSSVAVQEPAGGPDRYLSCTNAAGHAGDDDAYWARMEEIGIPTGDEKSNILDRE